MRLAAIQYKPPHGRPGIARDAMLALADEAGSAGAELIVFPEMATTGYLWQSPRELLPHAEPARGPTFRGLSDVARRHAATIVCGLPERFTYPEALDPEAKGRRITRLYNSAIVITPEGALATCYRKVLLFEADRRWASAGRRRLLCPTPLGPMAPAICMDINDPAFVRFLLLEAPAVVAFCTNWIAEGEPVHPYWRERLFGWSGWFIAANTYGPEGDVVFSGESAIIAPGGRVVAKAPPEGDHILIADT